MQSSPPHRLRLALIAFSLSASASRIATADFPYAISIAPTGDEALDVAVEEGSQLSALAETAPDSEAALRSRAANDRERLSAIIRAFGYYDGSVDIAVDGEAHPAKVTVTVTPGPRTLLASVSIASVDPAGFPASAPAVTISEIGLEPGKPALSTPIAAANGKIERFFQAKGFPFARIADRKAVVDHDTQRMDVTYIVDPGASALFGPTRVTGLEDVHEAYVRRRLLWTEGESYDVTRVEKTHDALLASNLFSTVEIKPVAEPGSSEPPMAVDLTERPPRSVAVGASYASTEGVAVNASWEHRNLFGEAEDLRFGIVLGQEQKSITADFRKPDLYGLGWDSVNSIAFRKETANAYDSDGERFFTGVEYQGVKQTAFGGGVAFEHATIGSFDLRQHYTLVGLPLYARRDTSDDLLNPTQGYRAGLTVTPYIDPSRTQLHFITGRLSGSIYQRLGDSDDFVFAAFGAIGATLGVSLDELPKDKRFYAGGGGSIRGYGFQRAGPIGVHDEPIGGLSSVEAGIELRYKLTETIGIVPFLDAGNVYASSFPDLSRRVFLGAGIGARYYTSLGPVRLDVATPLHQREGDSAIQIYVSLGQAF